MARARVVGAALLLLGAAPAGARAQLATLGMNAPQLFQQRCSQCHADGVRPAPNANDAARPAPPLDELRARQSPEAVYRMIDGSGLMAVHTRDWSADDKRKVAEFVTGKTLALNDVLVPAQGRCTAPPGPVRHALRGPNWNGWGVDAGNGRFQSAANGGLKAADVPRLKLKWAFAFPGATQAYAQPSVAAGRVFVGSETGLVYSIDAARGCFYWTFAADAPVRTAIVLGESSRASSGVLLYFGDLKANVYAIDAQTGTPVWKQQIDPHALARITGSPTLADGRLYVPVSGVGEEAQTGNPNYECCTFRGSVVSLDPHHGTVYWKSYTILQAPQPREKNARGVQLYAPAGASVWSAPTVDLARGALYVGTGNGFTRPAADTTDAVIAFSLKDGRLLWKNQLLAGDAVGSGPDFDIGATLILRRLPGGKDVLVVGQKSGDIYGLDPDRRGAQLWKVSVGQGGLFGGIEWGMAADERFAYAGISDYPVLNLEKAPLAPDAGALIALELSTGEQSWKQPGVLTCQKQAECHPAKSAALTAIPGVVFAGSMDGYLRAHATADGRTLADGRKLWEYNTAVEFTTVNGEQGKGGSINGPGPAIAGGMLFVSSGYSFLARGGNVLLAFAPE
jgi:polyvinyl alcohol dehydrogenase (cytochrome)